MGKDILGGGPFDFDGDGHTDSDEELMGLILLQETSKKEGYEPPSQPMDGLDIAQTVLGVIAVISAITAIAQLFE